MSTRPATPDERTAIGLYAVLDRDFVDFLDMVRDTSDEALKILYLMLATPRDDHGTDTRELNAMGADLVDGELKRRNLPLPEIPQPPSIKV